MNITQKIVSAIANKKSMKYGNVNLSIDKNNIITFYFSEKLILTIEHHKKLEFNNKILDFLNNVKMWKTIINVFLEYYFSWYIEKDKKSGVWIYCKIKDFDIKTWNYSLDKKDLINSMVIKLD